MKTLCSASNIIGILDKRYNLLERLDYGATSNVYKVLDTETKEIKVAKVFSEDKSNEFEKELNIIKSVSDMPYVIKFYTYGEGHLVIEETAFKRKYIILEYAKGSLFKFIGTLKEGFSENTCKYIFNQLILAIKYMHEKGICHRDLKLENTLLVGNDFSFRLCDFGLSISFLDINNQKIKLSGAAGSPYHYAPEILSGRKYDGERVDIFCAGICLICLVTGKFGFVEASRNDELYKLIMRKKYNDYWDIIDSNKKLSQSFKELFVKMVAYRPDNRPTIEEILNGEWLSVVKNANEEELNILKNGMINELNKINI